MDIREVTYLAVGLRVAAALLLGGLMGWERGMKNRAAGLRTYMLVCVGSCLIMLTNQFIFQTYGMGDPVRMGAQVISGIGFLGAGTIIVTRRNRIKGLTTAAGLWVAAAVGLSLGIGFYEAATLGAASVLLIMSIMHFVDNKMHRNTKSMEIYIELSQELSLGDLLRTIRAEELETSDIQKEAGSDVDRKIRAYTANLQGKKRRPHSEIIEFLLSIPGVIYVEDLSD